MTSPSAVTTQTLELIKQAYANPQQGVQKAFNQALNLVWFDLEPAAKLLFPVLTPLRNMIPRVQGEGGKSTNWKAITGINTSLISPGVSEGNRNAPVITSEQDFLALYAGLGLEDFETWEAEYASKNFDNIKALMSQNLLSATMIAEEQVILGGNASVSGGGIALGTPATPVLSQAANANGTLGAITISVKVVALTLDGFQRASIAGGVVQTIARTNADGSSDTVNGGSSNKSAAGTLALSANQTVTAKVTAIKGAVAYAWYWGVAGSELLGAITTVNTVSFFAAATGTQNASAITADCSLNSLVFNGLLSTSLSTNGYWQSLDGAPLTTDNSGGLVEIDAAFQSFWDNFRLSPTMMLMNSQEIRNVTKKVIAAGGGSLFQFNVQPGATAGTAQALQLTAGSVVGSYLNKFTMNGGQVVPIMLHPNVPPGLIVFYCDRIPYPMSRVPSVLRIKTRREYYAIEWAFRSRKYEQGVYCDELLENYVPFAFGAIGNILNG